jgi:glycosyltransferase involved in cell wall biosynthesis
LTPTFSVFTPTRNRRQWIRRCVQSVLSQSFEDWEMVVYDVSDQPIRDVLQDDPRIRYVRGGEAQGPAADFQAALELCTGEVVTPLADDDRLPRHALQTVADQIGSAAWLNGRTVLVNEANEPVTFRGGTVTHVEETMDGAYMLGGGVYWQRWLTDELGGFDPRFDGAADFDLYRRFLKHSQPVRCQETLYIHVVHEQQDTLVNRARQVDASRRIAEAA